MIARVAKALVVLVVLAAACGPTLPKESAVRDRLVVVTYNLWHGLNPVGLARFQEYETPAERETRLQGFLKFVRERDADVLILQEVNPAPKLTRRIADELGYDCAFVIDNAGLKIGSWGPPFNFRSGQAILAKRDLNLRALGSRKLSGGFGWTAWHSSLQLDEFRDALVAAITVNGRDVLLEGIHTHHGPDADGDIRAALDTLVAQGTITRSRAKEIVAQFGESSARRRNELEGALSLAAETGLAGGPTLFAGDFNASPGSPELTWLKNERGFASTTQDDDPAKRLITWDYHRNPNTHFFADFVPVNQFEPDVMRVLDKIVVEQSKRIDFILHRNFDGFFRVAEAGLFADEPHEGRYCSDHFGIYTVFEKDD